MQFSKWLSLLVAIILISACFFPWVTVEQKHITISGFHADNPNYGKPGIMHTAICIICLFFLFVNKTWSVRAAFFISVLNIAWASRNFALISACRGGICPVRHTALYVLIAASILFTLSTLLIKPEEAAPKTE
ncbi:MAG TPA: hypothetical protein VNR87_06310 [Flavisolibacter sp.]|nr:hypothetical protein [Flavisolibacter sp.]